MRQGLETYRSDVTCPVCKGERLRPELLSVYVGDGDKRYSYGEMNSMSLSQLRAAFAGLEFSERRAAVAERLTAAISSRLAFLENVGLGYLSLNRRADTLSGGEMQRIALARAILKDAPIVVLDEASSFADPENEAKIQKAFEALMKGKTVLMIAHRLSTVRNMDRILVIRDGGIAEEGKHDELLEKGGVYAAMWEEYQKAAQWKVGGAA